VNNEAARRIALFSTGLCDKPASKCNSEILVNLIESLAYVQLDPLQVIARSHDHILWSRNSQFRPKMLERLLEDRAIFEHFTHDACVLPMDTLPFWKNQFKTRSEQHTPCKLYSSQTGKLGQAAILERISQDGALCSKDFKSNKKPKNKAVRNKPEHKQILDYLWLKGDLAVAKRLKFAKYYDLSERVFPAQLINQKRSKKDTINYLASAAVDRLGFGTATEIMRFWDAYSLSDIRQWCEKNTSLITLPVESATGQISNAYLHRRLEALIQNPPKPVKRLRIINPFDPIVRDRKRLLRLFNFDFRIEIYVPAKKRKFGYYVYPLLEFDTFIGRIEVRHDKKTNNIIVDNLWHEPGTTFGKNRMSRLNSELQRLRRFCNAQEVIWSS